MKHATEKSPAPYGWEFEELKETMLALEPSMQPIFMDWLVALDRGMSLLPQELSRETGVPIEQSEIAELRRAVFVGELPRSDDEPLDVYARRERVGIESELELFCRGCGGYLMMMRWQLAELLPVVKQAVAAWPGRGRSAESGAPTE
ncbi:hypothetical protein GO613_01320 [Azoarcus communis]|uniref:hypothetical protein n=1 Tax=Parazoarcus communis TaxID=41977 RepID=UPI001459710C|nr:hypothetical protein [Parazoarcus communis]NMG46749.1 hypothetical protein [Parazoarcus communis]